MFSLGILSRLGLYGGLIALSLLTGGMAGAEVIDVSFQNAPYAYYWPCGSEEVTVGPWVDFNGDGIVQKNELDPRYALTFNAQAVGEDLYGTHDATTASGQSVRSSFYQQDGVLSAFQQEYYQRDNFGCRP